MRKSFTSVGLDHSFKDVILFSKHYVFDVVYVKSTESTKIKSESRGNTLGKARGSLWLRKQQIDIFTVQSRTPRLSMLRFVRSLNLNNSLNIKIRKRVIKNFWIITTQIIISYNNGTYFPYILHMIAIKQSTKSNNLSPTIIEPSEVAPW